MTELETTESNYVPEESLPEADVETLDWILWSETKAGISASISLDAEMLNATGFIKFCKTFRNLPKSEWNASPTGYVRRTEKYHGNVLFDADYVGHWFAKNAFQKLNPTASTGADYRKVNDYLALACPDIGLVCGAGLADKLQQMTEEMDVLPQEFPSVYAQINALLSTLA